MHCGTGQQLPNRTVGLHLDTKHCGEKIINEWDRRPPYAGWSRNVNPKYINIGMALTKCTGAGAMSIAGLHAGCSYGPYWSHTQRVMRL